MFIGEAAEWHRSWVTMVTHGFFSAEDVERRDDH